MCILTPDDKMGIPGRESHSWESFWTTPSQPSPRATQRIVSLAKDSLALAERLCMVEKDYSAKEIKQLWEAVFRSSLQSKDPNLKYDACLLLDPKTLDQGPGSKWSTKLFSNFKKQNEEKLKFGLCLRRELLRSLHANFEHLAEFHCDLLNGKEVGIVWKHGIQAPVPFRVAVSGSAKPLGKDQVMVNIPEILAEMVALGSGLVLSAKKL